MSRRRWWLGLVVCVVWVMVFRTTIAVAAAPRPTTVGEYRAFIFWALCSATTWKERDLGRQKDAFEIVFIGGNPLDDLDEDDSGIRYLKRLKVFGKKIKVTELDEGKKPGHCHVLYIDSTTDRQVVEEAIRAVQGKAVLTVGRHREFNDLGGMVRWQERGPRVGQKKLYCEFNLEAIRGDDLGPPRQKHVEKFETEGFIIRS